MKIKSLLVFISKTVLLTIVMFILFIIGTQLAGIGTENTGGTGTDAEQAASALLLLMVCAIDVFILVWFILRSRLYGIQLILATALIYYGVKTVMSQIEAWYFMSNITPEMLPKLFLMTIPVTLLFPFIAVPLFGKFKKNNPLVPAQNNLSSLSLAEWIWKIALLVIVIYPLLYFVFGYFIAWQNPELRAFYNGTDPGNFFAHMSSVFRNNPGLYFFQVFRGLCWLGLALIIIRSVNDNLWKMALLTAVVFSILMNDSLLIPNPLMPAHIRWTHFIETATSNFIWGWSIVGILFFHPKPK